MTALQPLLDKGIELHRAGDLAGAESYYRRARTVAPDSAEVHYLLALIAFQQGDYPKAESLARTALSVTPNHTNALLCLGQTQLARQQPDAAFVTLQTLSRLTPDWATAWEYFGIACQLCGLLEEAEEAYCRNVEKAPLKPEAWNHLATLYLECQQPLQAAKTLEHGLTYLQDEPTLLRQLGNAYRQAGKIDDARKAYRSVVRQNRNGALAITEAITLPQIYYSTDHLLECRRAMESRLEELENTEFPPCPDPIAAGGKNNFYSVYQGFDDRPLQERLARLWQRIYTPTWQTPPSRPPNRQRIKVGFVSAHFRHHTIGDLFSGLIIGLPREAFETVVIHLGEQRDSITDNLARHVDTFLMPRSNDLTSLAELIAIQACDILIYPDIGMEPLTYFLAFNRLAPIQATTWGHPLTTGLPSIDYYISSDLQEPPEAQNYYTEKLLRLAAIPAHISRIHHQPTDAVTQWKRRILGSRNGKIFGITQSLFKMHPAFDSIIAELLASDESNYVVLISDRTNQLALQLDARLTPVLGIFRNRLSIIPHLDFNSYFSLLTALDICLDVQPFGGGKTIFDALQAGTPVASTQGARLPGRTANAINQYYALDWPIATSLETMASTATHWNGTRDVPDWEKIELKNDDALRSWIDALLTMHGN